MLVVVEKEEEGKSFEFEMDEEFKFLIGMCSFYKDPKGYIYTTVNKKNMAFFANYGYKLSQAVLLHRILFELHNNRKLEKGEVIDHMDMCKTNNKIANLRAVTNSQNLKNRKLKTDQVYYNICYDKYDNYFKFRHQEEGIQRKFRSLHEALAFFLEYDKSNDYVLTKHIHEMKPMDGIENVVLTPQGKCDKCDHLSWNKETLKAHQKNNCPN